MNHKYFTGSIRLMILLFSIASHNGIAKDNNENVFLSIPEGIAAFKQSNFCKIYRCWLYTVEPLNFQNILEYYFYNYIIIDKKQKPDVNGKKALHPQVGIRMLIDNPYTDPPNTNYPTLIIRWFPVKNKQDIDLNIIDAICQTTVRRACPDLIVNGRQFISQMNMKNYKEITLQRSELWSINEDFIADYSLTTGRNTKRYPQFTFMLNYIPTSGINRK